MDQTLITVLRYSITYYQKDLFICAQYANKHKATALHKAYWLPCYFLEIKRPNYTSHLRNLDATSGNLNNLNCNYNHTFRANSFCTFADIIRFIFKVTSSIEMLLVLLLSIASLCYFTEDNQSYSYCCKIAQNRFTTLNSPRTKRIKISLYVLLTKYGTPFQYVY